MKHAFALIAATLVTTSLYSQDYSSSSSSSTSNPDSTPDYRSRQTESGAPPSSDTSSNAGYNRAPGLSGGNSSTGQSNGTNVGNPPDQDQSLTTRDSDLPGSEYRGTIKREPDANSAVGSSGTSVSGSGSSDETTVKGSESADGAFHQPAAPVREGSNSEGWSGSGTFSGAGPGSVSGSQSSSSQSIDDSSKSSSYSAPIPDESSENFKSDVSDNAALDQRDQDLRDRGLEPDSNQLNLGEESKMQNENNENNDEVLIFEDSQVVRPDENIGAPGESQSGTSNSSDEQYLDNRDQFDSTRHDNSNDSSNSGSAAMSTSGSAASNADSSYAQDLYRRTQKDWSARLQTDVPHTIPSIMDRTVDELNNTRFYNESNESEESIGAPGSSVSGSGSSKDSNCDHNKGEGSAAEFEHGYRQGSDDLDGSVRGSGTAIESDQRLQESSGAPGASVSGSASSSDQNQSLRSSGSAIDSDERLQREQDRYHINRGADDKYHINREASGDRSEETTAPGEYGDRPTIENYDDGHLNGNNAAGSSGSFESSSSGTDISRPDQHRSSPGQPQGGDENSATTPE